MTPQEWQRIKWIAGQAWEAPEADRAGLIQALSAGDDVLRQNVEALLRSTTAAEDLFEVPALTIPGAAAAVAASTRTQSRC